MTKVHKVAEAACTHLRARHINCYALGMNRDRAEIRVLVDGRVLCAEVLGGDTVESALAAALAAA